MGRWRGGCYVSIRSVVVLVPSRGGDQTPTRPPPSHPVREPIGGRPRSPAAAEASGVGGFGLHIGPLFSPTERAETRRHGDEAPGSGAPRHWTERRPRPPQPPGAASIHRLAMPLPRAAHPRRHRPPPGRAAGAERGRAGGWRSVTFPRPRPLPPSSAAGCLGSFAASGSRPRRGPPRGAIGPTASPGTPFPISARHVARAKSPGACGVPRPLPALCLDRHARSPPAPAVSATPPSGRDPLVCPTHP